jgi:hypothetical protein
MAKKKKAFQYPTEKPKKRQERTREFQRRSEGEQLTGTFDGQNASDIEERWGIVTKMLIEQGRINGYEFQPSYIAGKNLPGEVRVDFLWKIPPPQPIFLDGNFAHKSAEQRQRDLDKMDELDEALSGWALPAVRIPGKLLPTIEATITIANRVLAGETRFAGNDR